MRISIFGMGYVGVVSGACLVRDGHTVVGVDPVASKVGDLADGRSPIQEPGVPQLLAQGHKVGRLLATSDPAEGVRDADMVWVCVGTPSEPDGGINLAHVKAATGQIGQAIRQTGARPLVVVRSTSLPGTTEGMVIPALEAASGLTVGKDVHVVFHPEFLREATAVRDFDNPPKIVVGEAAPGAADPLMEVYEGYPGPRFRLRLGEAEMVKYCDNLFHAVKVTFANEVGAIARAAGVDARRVAEVFCSDTKLNISPRYLRPGFAFGGSCLPKDLKAMLRHATVQSLRVPMLQGIMESNALQIDTLAARIVARRPKMVGMVGLAFKAETDDMRESPYVKVAKRLIGEGITLRIYDPHVNPDRLIGSNKEAVLAALGHLQDLLVGSIEDLERADLILVNHRTVGADRVMAWLAAGIGVIDLADVEGVDRESSGYEGIAW